ncbi:MAG: MazG family protein [Nocardioidaceae bacterium]|nr:MazG family protein [Nocardioidaceae bacterium]
MSVAGLVVLVTSPRLPGGLLTAAAWRALDTADLVLAAADSALARAWEGAGGLVELVSEPRAEDLLTRSADAALVWLAGDLDGDLVEELATHVVRRSEDLERGHPGPEVEILVGSFDPVGARVLDLVEVMDRLRTQCPWDQQQTHKSLVRYLLEETYETVDAIESGDRHHLREELGDLLLQVAFHARIGTEDPDEPFGIDEVAAGIVEKLIRRHPHVFADVTVDGAADVESNWETIKATEKARASTMDEIPLGLPALSLAAKVVSRALRSAGQLSVPTPGETAYDERSLGEVLFAVAAAAAAAGLDPEQALRIRVAAEMEQLRLHEQRALPDEAAGPG